MEHYVTLFDSLFLPQGLALHMSMERHAGDYYTLWTLCVDDETHDILTKLNLPNVRLLQLSMLETDELKQVKADRSKGEYCWTVTPFAPRFVFETEPAVQRVTYLDADLWFRKNPIPIFREFDASGKHVLITDHAYAPECDHSATSGQYCVQFMTFTRDGEGVRKWWERRCIEWCYARPEDGKFGDQKYLDDWPERFSSQVHVLSDKEMALAPWNATRFPYSGGIFWHFHKLRISKIGSSLLVQYGTYPLPKATRFYVYLPYLQDLRDAIILLKDNGFNVNPQQTFTLFGLIKAKIRGVYQQMWRINQGLMSRVQD